MYVLFLPFVTYTMSTRSRMPFVSSRLVSSRRVSLGKAMFC